MRYIGCHLSSSAGFAAMGRTALSIGANTFQFFTRNPRGSRAKPVDPDRMAEKILHWTRQQAETSSPAQPAAT